MAVDLGPRSVLQSAWATGRSERLEHRAPPALLVKLTRFVARKLPTWQGVRTFVYSVAGLGLVTYAVYGLHHLAGFAVGGVSLLWLEYLGRRP